MLSWVKKTNWLPELSTDLRSECNYPPNYRYNQMGSMLNHKLAEFLSGRLSLVHYLGARYCSESKYRKESVEWWSSRCLPDSIVKLYFQRGEYMLSQTDSKIQKGDHYLRKDQIRTQRRLSDVRICC